MNAAHDLPPTAQVVAEVIGRDRTLVLARTVKFRSLYVPKRLPARHWLRDVLGDQPAEALVQEFQGMQLPLARCATVFKAERNRRVMSMREAGASVREIGLALGIPESTVWTVIYRNQRAA